MTQIASTPPGDDPRPHPRQRHLARHEDLRQHAFGCHVGGVAEQPSCRCHAGADRRRHALADRAVRRARFHRHHRGRRQPGSAIPPSSLSFGENGWSDDLVRREDAAGFGFASLSRRGCTVSSRPRSPDDSTMPGWRVDLVPGTFPGRSRGRSPSRRRRRRFRTGRRYRSRPPNPPPRSAMRPRMPPGITRCRSSSRASLPPSPATRRTSSANSSTAGPSSTARCTPNPGGASPSASSATAIAATTTRTSTSTA